jgi:hypothetical protein
MVELLLQGLGLRELLLLGLPGGGQFGRLCLQPGELALELAQAVA